MFYLNRDLDWSRQQGISSEWADATFPNATPLTKALHLKDEVEELAQNYKDDTHAKYTNEEFSHFAAEEFADCAHLLFHIGEKHGADITLIALTFDSGAEGNVLASGTEKELLAEIRAASNLLTVWNGQDTLVGAMLCGAAFFRLAVLASRREVDFYRAIEEKLEINRKRTWGPPDANGLIRHVDPVGDGDEDATEDDKAARKRTPRKKAAEAAE